VYQQELTPGSFYNSVKLQIVMLKVKVKGKPALKKKPNISETKDRFGETTADAKELPLWRQIFDLGRTGEDVKLGNLQFKSTDSGLQLSSDGSHSPLLEYKGTKLKNWLEAGGTTIEILENLRYTLGRYSLDINEIEISDLTVETKKLYASLKHKKGEAGMEANLKLATKAGPLELKFDTGKELGISFGRFNLFLSNDKTKKGGADKAEGKNVRVLSEIEVRVLTPYCAFYL
jgi:hypothetical protein